MDVDNCYIFVSATYKITIHSSSPASSWNSAFQLGAVRMLHKKDLENEWNKLESWLHNNRLPKKLIGLGGNIRTFLNIFNEDSMSSDVFMNKYSELANFSTDNKNITDNPKKAQRSKSRPPLV